MKEVSVVRITQSTCINLNTVGKYAFEMTRLQISIITKSLLMVHSNVHPEIGYGMHHGKT
jgi:hypothetical protein